MRKTRVTIQELKKIKPHFKWAPMENIDKFEENKLAHTDYHADAAF